NVAFGLSGGSPTADDLAATGAMMVSLSSNQTQLSIAGPSGIGFRLDITGGLWQDSTSTSNGLIKHSFGPNSSSASVKLHTGSFLGDIPLPGAALVGMKVTTKGTSWSDPAGEFEQIAFGPGGIIPLNTRDPLGPFTQLGAK